VSGGQFRAPLAPSARLRATSVTRGAARRGRRHSCAGTVVAVSAGMSTVILSAGSPALPSLQALEGLVRAELAQKGEREVRTFELATTPLAYCQGEFDCWVKTPGVCRAHDAEQDIVAAVHAADRMVLIDEVTYGGHSYAVKRAQDRMICLVSPFFEKRAGLTHHAGRYDQAASFYALGWMPRRDDGEARTWCELADGNALNMLAPSVGAVVVDDQRRDAWAAEVCAMLTSHAHPGASIDARAPLRAALLEAARPALAAAAPVRPRTAAVLIGSAKVRGTSVSEVLARALIARLERAGVATTLHIATDFVHARKAAAVAQQLAAAELFVLVTPLYVDALPALVVRALEHVAAAGAAGPRRCAAIVNCGFPEPEHVRTALRIVRHFCARAGYAWAGGLPLGAGGVVKPGVPLDEQHGPVTHVAQALDVAAPALAIGADVPAAALERMLQAPVPDAAYRLLGDLGWRYQAYRNGLAQRALRAQPLA
jgi:NAD(P)H-dependent FMN reductase